MTDAEYMILTTIFLIIPFYIYKYFNKKNMNKHIL